MCWSISVLCVTCSFFRLFGGNAVRRNDIIYGWIVHGCSQCGMCWRACIAWRRVGPSAVSILIGLLAEPRTADRRAASRQYYVSRIPYSASDERLGVAFLTLEMRLKEPSFDVHAENIFLQQRSCYQGPRSATE